MKGCLGVIGGIFILTFLVAACATMFGSGSNSTRSNVGSDGPPNLQHSDHKAVASLKRAEQIVGGFDSEQRALYKKGLQHIANEHQNLGSFTIAQVIDDQRSRNDTEAAAEQAEKERARAAEDAHFFHGDPDCIVLDNRSLHTDSDDYVAYVEGTVTNRCDRELSYVQVEINFYDSSGNQDDSGLANVNNLAAGDSWNFKALQQGSGSGKWRIEKISGY